MKLQRDDTNTYDRQAPFRAVQKGTMTDALSYDLANKLLTESFTGGPLIGLSVTNGYDQFLRRTNLTSLSTHVISRTLYGNDNASRLLTVYDGTNSATDRHLANLQTGPFFIIIYCQDLNVF